MLVTIRNLPANTRYADLKALILTKCGLTEMILDNLTPDGNNAKKVTVGLAEEEDAAILMRKINGLRIEGQQVFVEAIKKKQAPGSIMNEADVSQQPTLQQPYYQQSGYQPSSYQLGYTNLQNGVPSISYAGLYGVPTSQNAFANYGYPQQMQYQPNQMTAQSMTSFDQDAPLGFSNQGNNSTVWENQNDWNPAGRVSGGNRTSQQSRSNSRWDNSDDNMGRSRRDVPARSHGRDESSRNFGRDTNFRDVGRSVPSRDFGRKAQSHDSGRDAPSRDRGRDAPRDRRDAPYRERGGDSHARDRRDAPARSASGRDNTRNDYDRGPSKRQFSANTAPGKSSGSVSQMNKFSQQRNKPSQNRAPNIARKAQGDYNPPVKRLRTNTGSVEQFDTNRSTNNDQAQTLNKKKPKKNDQETLVNRASTWRCQIASAVAKDIIKNPRLRNDIEKPQFLTELKRGIRHRLEMLFGDNIKISQEDMLRVYREKYRVDSDAEFFKEVTEDIKNHGAYVADDIKKAVPSGKTVGAGSVKKTPSNLQGVDTKKEDTKIFKKIPSYPQGDKRLNKEFKKASVQIFKDTESLISRLKPDMQKALDEEIEEMAALIAEEFQDDPEPGYETLHKQAKTVVIDEYKQMLKVNFAKRVLNIRPIMLRIFNTPKVINRSKLAPILAEYGIDSLRKSERKTPMYFGTCKTYEQHDKLCDMEPLVVDGSRIVIKPFHLTGFNEKVTKEQIKMQRQKISQTYANMSGDSMVEKEELNEEVDEDIGNLNVEEEQNQGQSEHENKETEDGQAIETVENGDTLDNGKELEGDETLETCENGDAENIESIDTQAEGNYEEEETELKKEISTEVDNLEVVDNESKENEQVEAPPSANLDCTGDSELNDESHIEDNCVIPDEKPSESDNLDADKDISINPEDEEDVEGADYEDIEMDDVNDDDLEDW